MSRMRHARYGKISVQRDEAYSSSRGNLSLALALAEQQLAIYYSPRVLHDLATLRTTLGEESTGLLAMAHHDYALAQRVAVAASGAFLRFFTAASEP